MSYPVKERLMIDLHKAVAAVQEANGYSYNLKVERYNSKRYVPEHLKTVIYQIGEDRLSTQISDRDERVLQVGVDVFVMPTADDDTPADRYCNLIEADLVKAIKLDTSRGGLAIDCECDPAEPFSDTIGEVEGFTLQVNLRYRTGWDDPYAVR